MPSRNSIKKFQSDAIYHVYNRGVAKRNIFLDDQDYRAFLRRLELMLLPKEETESVQRAKDRIRITNYHKRVHLQAFCLMANHFHLMLWHADESAITQFMHTLSTSYSMYFNRKYKRVGPLFQGRFKAVWVDDDDYHIHLSRYIHCNPLVLGADVYTYSYSSLQYYFEPNVPRWLQPGSVQEHFADKTEYQHFIDDLSDIKAAETTYSLN